MAFGAVASSELAVSLVSFDRNGELVVPTASTFRGALRHLEMKVNTIKQIRCQFHTKMSMYYYTLEFKLGE